MFGYRHRWSLRVVELEAGRVVCEIPATGSAAPVFSQDEAFLFHVRPSSQAVRQDVIAKLDLASGRTIRDYAATDRVFEPVGIAVSPDGKLVAGAYYYGQIFVWDSASGRLVSRHDVLRPDGARDTFFQASTVRFSPDGKLLAAAAGSRLRIIDAESGNVKAQDASGDPFWYAHLRWSRDSKKITLLTSSTIGEFADTSGFPPKPTADILPRLVEWEWGAGPPSPTIASRP